MKVKQLRFTRFTSGSNLLSFKGFILKFNNVIISEPFTVVKSQPVTNGSLTQLIIPNNVDYLALSNIEFPYATFIKKDFEIIIEFNNEIDFDNIQCVCGSNKKLHFKNIKIEYKGLTGNWLAFNKPTYRPEYQENSISNKQDFIVDSIYSLESIRWFKNSITATNSSFGYIHKSFDKIKTGKHFVEITLLNSDRKMGSTFGLLIGVFEADIPLVNFTTTGPKGYFTGMSSSGSLLRRMTGTGEIDIEKIGSFVPDSSIWPEHTVGFFVDLDNNKIRAVFNGIYITAWYDIIKTKPDQEYFFITQIRNMGGSSEYTINYPPKYTYQDLTSEYKKDHFASNEGWVKRESVIIRNSSRGEVSIDWPWTTFRKGIQKDIKHVHTTQYLGRLSAHEVGLSGYGYFKNTVFIDYPPKEPISKRVCLYSVKDAKVVQQVWSDPLSGLYEFKHVRMKQPYLIFTYDSDEDYNAAIIGPVYPTLMPEFEGLDLTLIG